MSACPRTWSRAGAAPPACAARKSPSWPGTSHTPASAPIRPTYRRTAVVTALATASPEFRAWWQEYPVNEFRPATIGLSHPTAGELDLQLYQLQMVEDPDLLLVLQLPATDENRCRIAATLDRSSPAPD